MTRERNVFMAPSYSSTHIRVTSHITGLQNDRCVQCCTNVPLIPSWATGGWKALSSVKRACRCATRYTWNSSTVNVLHGKTCSIVPSDEEGEVGLSVDQVCAYYKRLLKKGAENTCYAINYRIEKKFGGFAADLAKSGCTLNHWLLHTDEIIKIQNHIWQHPTMSTSTVILFG